MTVECGLIADKSSCFGLNLVSSRKSTMYYVVNTSNRAEPSVLTLMPSLSSIFLLFLLYSAS